MNVLRLATFVWFWLCAALAFAADPAPLVETKLSTQGDLWRGQRVVINLTLKTPGIFSSAPSFDVPQVSGAILVPPAGRPVLGTETIGDDSFTTQTHEFSVFPQRSGTLTIPPFSIRFDASAGFGKPVQARQVITTAISFPVQSPPGTDHFGIVLTTTTLNVEETWKPEPAITPVPVGTAFTRTIQTTANNLPGIVLPSFHVELPVGLKSYDGKPLLNDQDNRGELAGQRTDMTTIVCERAGKYDLPAMTVSWWNPEEKELHHVTLPAQALTVTAPIQPDASIPPGPSSSVSTRLGPSRWMVIIALAGIVCGLICFRHIIRRHWDAFIAVVVSSEPYFFRKVVHACRSSDAHATYRSVLAWREKLESRDNPHPSPTIDAFSNNPELLSAWQSLESSLYHRPTTTTSPSWSPPRLLACLKEYRVHWKRTGKSSTQSHKLPAMNPSCFSKIVS